MAVRTTADEILDRVKDNLNKAQKELLLILDTDTWGSDNYSKEYIETLEEILLALSRIKRDL